MIRAHFGISKDPFSLEGMTLLKHQQDIHDTIKVHSQQGGLCLILGEPGTGKSVTKQAILHYDEKRTVTVSIARTLHTYINTIKILCNAFAIDYEGSDFKCEKRLIDEAVSLNHQGKSLITIIDDAHLMAFNTLRKLRLLFEEFPKNHNLILVGQPYLLVTMSLKINEDIKSRVTYSALVKKLLPEEIETFIETELKRCGLARMTFTDEALGLVVRSSDGILRRARNLCLSCLLETVRDHTKEITLDIVNRVLLQPHWRQSYDLEQV